MHVDILIFTGTLGAHQKPAGPYRIATELRKQGYTVQVVDDFLYLAGYNNPLLLKIIDKFVGPNTLWVGFSNTFFVNIQAVQKQQDAGIESIGPFTRSFSSFGLSMDGPSRMALRNAIKAKNSKCQIVVGGAKATNKGVTIADAYIEGYADTSVIQYTRWLQGKEPFFRYTNNAGIPKWSYNSISVDHDPKASTFDFANSQIIWDPSDLVSQNEALPIEISRGCIFSCDFCSFPLNGKNKRDHWKNPNVLLEELERNYELYKTTDYMFGDDTYNDSPEKLEMLYNEVFSKLSFKLSFYTYIRLDLLYAHKETIDLLYASGLRGVHCGIESLYHPAAKSIGKGLQSHKVIELLHLLRERWKRDVKISGSFIIGLPTETEQTARAWLDEIIKPEFPLDSVFIYPLMLSAAKGWKNWQSEFEKNPSKYGYQFDEKGNWYNEHFQKQRVEDMSREYGLKAIENHKNLISDYSIPGFLNFGIPRELIQKGFRMTDLPKEEFDRMMRERRTNYFTKLLKL